MASEPPSAQEQLRWKSALINAMVDRLSDDDQVIALCSGAPGVFGGAGPPYGVYVLTGRELLWRNEHGQCLAIALGDVQQLRTTYVSQYCVYVELVTHGGHQSSLALAYSEHSSGKDFYAALEATLRDARASQAARNAPPTSSILDELEKLDALRRRGVLTRAEFETQKRRLLGDSVPASDDEELEASNAKLQRLRRAGRPADVELAEALNEHAGLLAARGRTDDALTTIDMAVSVARTVAARDETVRRLLALLLGCQSAYRAAAGHTASALEANDVAIEIQHDLVGSDPDVRYELAASLHNRSLRLHESGDDEAALAAIDYAIKLRAQLSTERIDIVLPDLAGSLSARSVLQNGLGQPGKALASVNEAIDIYQALAGADPEMFAAELAGAVHNRSLALGAQHRHQEARVSALEAIARYRHLANAVPARFEPLLAAALRNLARQDYELWRQPASSGPLDEGLAALDESVTILRRLADDQPRMFASAFVDIVCDQTVILADAKGAAAAVEVSEQALLHLLPTLERTPEVLPDAGSHLMQIYLLRSREAGMEGDLEIMARMVPILKLDETSASAPDPAPPQPDTATPGAQDAVRDEPAPDADHKLETSARAFARQHRASHVEQQEDGTWLVTTGSRKRRRAQRWLFRLNEHGYPSREELGE